MNHEDERNYKEELAVAIEYEREQWEELGHEHAQMGRSRSVSRKWLTLHATVNQERAFWRGFQRGEVTGK